MNENKKLKREKKKEKKIKKIDSKNKSAGKKQMLIKVLPIVNELPKETIQIGAQGAQEKFAENNDNSDDEADKTTDPSETQMLDSLTGIPYAEDELLFAVPVVAPYTALTNYK
jgi:hypothetical protein